MEKNNAKIFSIVQIILSCIIIVLASILIFNKSILFISKVKLNNIIISLLVILNLLTSYIEFKFNKNKAKGVFYIAMTLLMVALLFIGISKFM